MELVPYVNMLTLLAFKQAVEIENMRRLLDRNAETLNKCNEVIKGLMEMIDG